VYDPYLLNGSDPEADMRVQFKFPPAAVSLTLLAALTLTTSPQAGPPVEDTRNSHKTVIYGNASSYLWLLPQFWMAGEESYAYFRIENSTDETISIYMHCHTPEGTLPQMTGRHMLRPRQVFIVDSRKYRAGSNGPVLVRCSLKSRSRATVKYLIRDSRTRHFGNFLRVIRPEIS
jgi:hypothetical protein